MVDQGFEKVCDEHVPPGLHRMTGADTRKSMLAARDGWLLAIPDEERRKVFENEARITEDPDLVERELARLEALKPKPKPKPTNMPTLPMRVTYREAILLILADGRERAESEVMSYFAPEDHGGAASTLVKLAEEGEVTRREESNGVKRVKRTVVKR